jgi:hypothetical protein
MMALAVALALGACQKGGSEAGAAEAANAAPPAATPVSTAATAGGDAGGPKAFLEGLYAHYKSSSSTGTSWAPMGADVKDVFDPDTVQLLAADTKALKGELGEIDGDWLCDCQDWGSITAAVTVTSQSPTAAKATAAFRDTQVPDEKDKRNTFDLVKTPAGWRIHDMGTPQDASLRHVLTNEITGLKSGAARPLSD